MPFTPDPIDPTRRAALLDRIRAEVPRRRARRRAIASVGTAAVVLVGVGLALVPGAGDGPERLEVADGGERTTAPPGVATTQPVPTSTPATPITTIPETTTVVETATTTSVTPDPTQASASSATTGPVANQPVTIVATAEPGPPYEEGETVRLTFTIDDPDAEIRSDCVHVVAHHTITTLAAFPGCDTVARCDTAAPPPPVAGHLVVTYDVQLVHEQNTSVLVQVTVRSGPVCPDQGGPYASTADQTFEYSWG
jgi:hypothetical protein